MVNQALRMLPEALPVNVKKFGGKVTLILLGDPQPQPSLYARKYRRPGEDTRMLLEEFILEVPFARVD